MRRAGVILLDNLIFPQGPGQSLGQEEFLEEKELVLHFPLEARRKHVVSLNYCFFFMFGKCAYLKLHVFLTIQCKLKK